MLSLIRGWLTYQEMESEMYGVFCLQREQGQNFGKDRPL